MARELSVGDLVYALRVMGAGVRSIELGELGVVKEVGTTPASRDYASVVFQPHPRVRPDRVMCGPHEISRLDLRDQEVLEQWLSL